ncbi:MAG: cytochrome b N-terminal domain-containing protein [Candidatus Binatia bacterium]
MSERSETHGRRRPRPDRTGPEQFVENLRSLPTTLKESVVRHSAPRSDRSRSQAIFSNLFLHVHATRTHVRSLRFSATLGLGIASISMFLILLVTGVLLMVYYTPSTLLAYDSMKDIHFVVPTGRLIRNIHRWAAHLMVGGVMLHMCRVFYTASYKPPREFNWIIGMGLFVCTLALSFTGYLLPWDQLAFWAITIGANIAASPSELTDALGITEYFDPGGFQKRLLLGSSEVGQDALTRFYLLHVMVLPIVLVMLVGVHFWRIRKDGGIGRPGPVETAAGKGALDAAVAPSDPSLSPSKTYGLMCVVRGRSAATGQDSANTVPSWPYLLRAELLVFMICMLICVVLGIAYDAPLKELANPAVPENPAKAPWYFLGLQEMVSYSAFMGGLVIPAVAALGLALIPYLDREPEDVGIYCSGSLGRKIALRSFAFAALFAVLAVAVPVNFGWLRNWFPGISQLVIILINPGSLLTLAYAGWSLMTLHQTRSTRMAAIALFSCFLVGFIIMTYVGMSLRGPNWDFYWSQSDWPVH